MFVFKGKPKNASMEFVRAWFQATACVLAYHNLPIRRDIEVRFRRLPKGIAGYHYHSGLIEIDYNLRKEKLATTIPHEVIHEVIQEAQGREGFGEGTDEKCTSTLTAKLRPLIKPIAEQLIKNTYRGAAFIAHTKMSYRATDGDHYDRDEDKPIGVKDRNQLRITRRHVPDLLNGLFDKLPKRKLDHLQKECSDCPGIMSYTASLEPGWTCHDCGVFEDDIEAAG